MRRIICIMIVGLLAIGVMAGIGSAHDASQSIKKFYSVPATKGAYTTHTIIRINNDSDFDTQFPGRVISGYDINGSEIIDCIRIENCKNSFTIINCYLHNSKGSGIFLYYATNGYITNNNISSNGDGIVVEYSDNTVLTDNNLYLNSRFGINIVMSKSGTLINNVMTECSIIIGGKLVDFNTHNIGSNNLINGKPVQYFKNQSNCLISGNNGEVILVNCTNVTVNNQITSNGTVGILLGYSNDCLLLNNTCIGNSCQGIYLAESNFIMCIGNNCSNNRGEDIYCGYGIDLIGSSNNMIVNNNCSENRYSGIELRESHENTLINNSCYVNKNYGIILADSVKNNFTSNKCYNNGKSGIWFIDSGHNLLTGNNLTGNSESGISIKNNSDTNTLIENNCSQNAEGISIAASFNIVEKNILLLNKGYGTNILDSNNAKCNHIFKNNFIDNNNGKKQAYDGANRNFWNISTDGNYWSDWTSPDNDSDGIVDRPYIMDGNTCAKDYFPLVFIIKKEESSIRRPIRINSDADFDIQFPGRVISGYQINGTGKGYCLFIGNCSKPFTIKNCYLHDASRNMIQFYLCTGLYLYNTSNGSISNNLAALNTGLGIYMENSSANAVYNNRVSTNGLYLTSSNGNTIYSNTINDSKWNCDGISLSLSNNNRIYLNNIANTNIGIYFSKSDNNTIEHNNLTHNHYPGISMHFSNNNNISENLITDTNISDGIELISSNYNEIYSNFVIKNANFGIVLSNSRNNNVSDNNISSNHRGGLVCAGNYNCIKNNMITYNSEDGISVSYGTKYNVFFHNYFINNDPNRQQAYDASGNNFWNGSNNEGNYWSDWTSPDNNNDGIVDIPYVIDGNRGAKDYYPLVSPNGHTKYQNPVSNLSIFIIACVILGGIIVIGSIIFFVPPFYTRIRRERVMDHFIRGQVYDHIRKNPGASSEAIKTDLILNRGTLAYHLRTLELQGFIKSKKEGKYRKYYEIDAHPSPGDGRRYSKLQLNIIKKLKKQPGLCQSELSRKLNIPLSVLNYNVNILLKQGVIKSERGKWGRMKCFVDLSEDENTKNANLK